MDADRASTRFLNQRQRILFLRAIAVGRVAAFGWLSKPQFPPDNVKRARSPAYAMGCIQERNPEFREPNVF